MRKIYIAPSVENIRYASESQLLSESSTRLDGLDDLPVVKEEIDPETEEIGAKPFSWGFEEYGSDFPNEENVWNY